MYLVLLLKLNKIQFYLFSNGTILIKNRIFVFKYNQVLSQYFYTLNILACYLYQISKTNSYIPCSYSHNKVNL